MKELIDKVLKSVTHFSIWDFGFMKIGLISFGALIGAYFSKFILSNILLIWLIFIVSYVYIIYITFLKK